MDELDEESEIRLCLNALVDQLVKNESSNNLTRVSIKQEQFDVDFDRKVLHKRSFQIDNFLMEPEELEMLRDLDEYFRHVEDLSQDQQIEEGLFMSNLRCDACQCRNTLFWRRVAREKIVCNACFHEKAYLILFDDEHLSKEQADQKEEPNSPGAANNENSNSSITNNNNRNKNKSSSSSKNSKNGNNQRLIDANSRPLTRTTRKQTQNGQPNSDLSTETKMPPVLQTQLSTSSNNSSSSNSNTNNGSSDQRRNSVSKT
jgi:hypothetical protein